MPVALVTGGSGFLGSLLVAKLLEDGWTCTNIDLQPSELSHPRLLSIQGDIRNDTDMRMCFASSKPDVVFHCAAILAHGSSDDSFLWTSNVDGTRSLVEHARANKVGKLVFTSSNCLWGDPLHRPVREDDEPRPAELYGRSKWEGEKILERAREFMDVTVFRCPTIIDAGRLGLLTILFEFIAENRRVWVVGSGDNRYQFIYAPDLIDGMLRGAAMSGSGLFGIGSDRVMTLREIYSHVIRESGSSSEVASLPRGLSLLGMKAAYRFGVSPLGPYHYKMIAEDFEFDTSLIKSRLRWAPTFTNEQMLLRAYQYWKAHRAEIASRRAASAHRQPAKMGVIRALKWVS